MDYLSIVRRLNVGETTSLLLRSFSAMKSDRRAVTALEYGLIAALIAVFIIGSVTGLGGAIKNTFSTISSTITAA
jgi:pilus assembly protein Flp/PilA